MRLKFALLPRFLTDVTLGRGCGAIFRSVTMKRCPACKDHLPHSEFTRNRRNKDGLCTYCRECKRAKKAEYRSRNKEKISKSDKIYKANNKEKINAASRARRVRDPLPHRVKSKAYYLRNKEKVAIAKAKWSRENKEKRSASYAVNTEIRAGRMKPAEQCEMCGDVGTLDGHHDSYDKDRWLVVIWLCKPCHVWLHGERRRHHAKREK
jgi:hypothetical protein